MWPPLKRFFAKWPVSSNLLFGDIVYEGPIARGETRAPLPSQPTTDDASLDLPQPPHRTNYLDALRGLAAVQVLLLHFASGLAPSFAFDSPASKTLGGYVHASPLFFLYDGYSAVYLFFCLSGYVLTFAFARQAADPVRAVNSRIIRLGLPALASTLLAAAFFALFGGENSLVAQINHSDWYGNLWHPTLGFEPVLKDGFVNALFLGYIGVGPFPLKTGLLSPVSSSFNTPLWTLSIEFYGSLLILALCWLRNKSPRLWKIAAALCLIFFLRTHFVCFVLGHLFAVKRGADRQPFLPPILSLLLAVFGVFLCVYAEFHRVRLIELVCEARVSILPNCFPSAYHLQKIFGATIFVFAVTQLLFVRRQLVRPSLLALGSLSFPIYLVHFPVLFGLSAFAFLKLTPLLGTSATQVVCIVAGIAATLVIAALFKPIDEMSIDLSRRLRKQRMKPSVASDDDGIYKKADAS
jgi:peptidoglycan/LPS O-acetylase OafA/YrhL